ncbi:hypothetical protein AL073_06310 [Loktanella sp. 1ANDIMAR09]|nr:hypothetical protein AL073_06310 [Loktanella sp. 1ANDIMAR09]
MSGVQYLLLAAALVFTGVLLHSESDALVSSQMINIVSKIQIECNKHSIEVNGVNLGCQSFADVRKIDMRADNRNRSFNGDRLVQIGR